MKTHEGLLTFDRSTLPENPPEPDTAMVLVTPGAVTLIAEDGQTWTFDRRELAAMIGPAAATAKAA